MDGPRIRMQLLLAQAALGCVLGSGCTAGGGAGGDPYDPNDGRYDRAQPYADGAERPVRRYDDGSGYDDGRYDNDAARPPRPAPGPAPPVVVVEQPLIPKAAGLRAEGRGDLSFKATRDGYVYILDSRDHKLVYEGPLDEGETILIAPYRNVIEVDGRRVKRVKDLDNKHIHKVFFERDGRKGRGGGR
jgi:hypothetical protein